MYFYVFLNKKNKKIIYHNISHPKLYMQRERGPREEGKKKTEREMEERDEEDF